MTEDTVPNAFERIPNGAVVAVAPGGIPIQMSVTDHAAHTAASYRRNLFPDHANWYRDNVGEMSISVLNRHQSDLDGKLALYERNLLPLTETDRMEITESIRVIAERLDEILPKVPAAIDEHDRNVGNRVHDNWPEYLQKSTLQVHLHFCELIDSWRIHHKRRFTGHVGVNEAAEVKGESAFDFDSNEDLRDFLDNYQLDDFVVTRTSYQSVNNKTSYYLVLSNKFTAEEVNKFLDVYKSSVARLSTIYGERRRAVNVDGGRIGFIVVDHFATREVMEMERINAARTILGAGAKVRT